MDLEGLLFVVDQWSIGHGTGLLLDRNISALRDLVSQLREQQNSKSVHLETMDKIDPDRRGKG
jgi:hypothetical protein